MTKLNINEDHPLANGLIGCWVPGIMRGINLAGTSGDLSPASTSGSFDLTSEGPGFKTATAADGLTVTAPAAFLGNSNSYYWRGVIRGTTSLGVPLIGIEYNNATGFPFLFQSLSVSGTANEIIAEWNTGGSYGASAVSSTATDGVMAGFAATFLPGGNASLYKNGVFVTSDVYGASNPVSTATSGIVLHVLEGVLTRAIVGSCNIACIWNRELSASEIAALDADPYALLIPDEGEWPSISVYPTPVFSSSVFSHDFYLGLQVFSMEASEAEQAYAAFGTPQRDGQVVGRMVGY